MFFYKENILQLVEAWLQLQILSGSLAVESGDQFGYSIDVNSSGDRVVICAKSDEKTGTTGQGIAYIFVSGAGGWIEQQILSGSFATNSGDDFGFSVAMNSSGDRVVIGAMNDERISGSSSEGLAYIFVSGSDGWLEQQILSGSLATNISDSLGRSVAINSIGDIVVVGAHFDEKIQSSEGVVYIFVSGNNGWVEQQILSGSRTNAGDRFGTSVAINLSGDYIVVGAERDDGGGSASGAGAAYVYVSGTNGWTQQQILSGTLAGTSDSFGRNVEINSNGNIIVVTAPNDERSGQSSLLNEGLAYIFVSGAGGWTQQQILSGSLATGSFDNFGYSVAMNSAGDLVIVGAPADEAIGAAASSGLVYVFVSGAGGWIEQHILSGSLANQGNELFGWSVAINSAGDRAIIGAYNDESINATSDSGLVYLFDKKLV